jgi:hypothetical protein
MSTSVDDETILEVLRSNDAPRMTTTEVAGHLPVTRGTTRTRLQALVDDDLLERKTEGNNVVWWLPERADELDAWEAEEAAGAADESTEATPEEQTEATPEEQTEATPEEQTEATPEEQTDAAGDDGSDEAPEDGAVDEAPDPDVEANEPLDTAGEAETTEETASESDADTDATAVEVEAVDPDGDDSAVAETTETRTASDRPDLSRDEEGIQALALLAAVLTLFLLLRKLRGGAAEDVEDAEQEEPTG